MIPDNQRRSFFENAAMTIQARFRPFFNRLLGHALRTAARAIKLQRLFSPAFRRQNDALNLLETSTGLVVVKPAAGTGAGAGVTAGRRFATDSISSFPATEFGLMRTSF